MEIVCLQNGNKSTVAYCLPSLAGTVDHFFELAKAIGPGHLVYGIQFADRLQNGKFKEFASLQEMAAAMVPDLLARHRDSPICLIGHSFSAFLAIELAQQLVENGRLVPLVVMSVGRGPPASLIALRIKHFIKNVGPWALRVATRAVTNSRFRLNYRNAMIHKLRLSNYCNAVFRKQRWHHKFVGWSWFDNLPKDYQEYVMKNDANLRNYRFEGAYRGKILLFCERPLAELHGHPMRFDQLEDYGWGVVTGATVDVVYCSEWRSLPQHPEVIANALRPALSECDQTLRTTKSILSA